MGKEIRIKCRKIYGGKATGEALVTREAVSGWGGTDPLAGKIIERTHEISGAVFSGKIFITRGAKGSSGWTNAFHISRMAGTLPKAIIFQEISSKIALGCVVMKIPAVTDLEEDIYSVAENGDIVTVDADNGEVIIEKP